MTAGMLLVEALIVVDVQTAFFSGDRAVPAAAPLLERITSLIARGRTGGALIVHVQNDGPAGAVDQPGTPGWRLCLPVEEGPDEVVIRKTADDAFYQTGLLELLTARRVSSMAICGVMSEMCVSATARTAVSLDFQVAIAHNTHASYDIPAAPGISSMVPAATVSRVAEWALGDEVDIVASDAYLDFAAPTR